MAETIDRAGRRGWSNTTIAIACVCFFAGMVGMAYASVPLYRLFCQVTGYGGTTQRVEQASDRVLDQTINVRFDANTNGIGWDFKPAQRQVTLKIGETTQVSYEARNILSTASTGTATFNVTPQAAGAYFNKVECFCFTETTLQPDETLDMPVVFFVDPDIVDAPELKGVSTITLSYTFFPVDDPEPVAQSSTTAVQTTTIR
ncbi:cytochrome c oxidase assembly protein [Oricola sp.]|uniref:cytochrome c oxidase assembly protein n=1 Tax=Oricola sp. TaxID=1979950 RepID=UPI003BA90C55